jgi:hypothetical protein
MGQALVNDAALPRSAAERGAESVQPMSGFKDYTSAQESKQKCFATFLNEATPGTARAILRAKTRATFLFRRPHRRYLPLQGRECRNVGSRGSNHGLPGSHRPNVCGVKLLGTDGAASMAAIVTENELDFALFRDPPLAASCHRYTRLLFPRAVGSRPPRHSNTRRRTFRAMATIPPSPATPSISTTPQREGS